MPRRNVIFWLLVLTLTSAVLVPLVGWKYCYDNLTIGAGAVGFTLLLVVAGCLSFFAVRRQQQDKSALTDRAVYLGILLGFLWVIEISINNFVAPPMPARDIIDNVFWAVIALAILSHAVFCGYKTGRIGAVLAAGVWSGSVSGLIACCMALSTIVFFMRFITHDPLNIAEWAGRGAKTRAPTMAAYFAFETFAGAFLHLIVLGILMGMLLGLLGGALGYSAKLLRRFNRRN
jgi:hypothetical protein